MAKCKVGFGALGLNPDDATGFRLGCVAAGGGSLSCLRDGPRGTHPRDAKVKEHGTRGAEVFLSTKSGFAASRLLFAVPCRTLANDTARGPLRRLACSADAEAEASAGRLVWAGGSA